VLCFSIAALAASDFRHKVEGVGISRALCKHLTQHAFASSTRPLARSLAAAMSRGSRTFHAARNASMASSNSGPADEESEAPVSARRLGSIECIVQTPIPRSISGHDKGKATKSFAKWEQEIKKVTCFRKPANTA
jgi:hypothetical protein